MKNQWNLGTIRVFNPLKKENEVGVIGQLSNSECGTNLIIFQDHSLYSKKNFYVFMIPNLPYTKVTDCWPSR
jgi:hypothetical protein